MDNPKYEPDEEADITDAALLMSADGYGRGKVVGESEGVEVIIRTTETKKSFLHAKEPEPEELAKDTRDHFIRISKERDMEH